MKKIIKLAMIFPFVLLLFPFTAIAGEDIEMKCFDPSDESKSFSIVLDSDGGKQKLFGQELNVTFTKDKALITPDESGVPPLVINFVTGHYSIDGIKKADCKFFNLEALEKNNTENATSKVRDMLFNKNGERIILKEDGTWINEGKPSNSSGIIVRNIGLSTIDYLYDGEKRQKCELKVEIINNSTIDMKEFGVSYDVYDDYNERKMFMFSDYSKVTKVAPGSSKFLKHQIPKNCNLYTEGGWYISGDVNEYSVEAKDSTITTDEILKYVIWSNDGVLPFKNGQ
tara:strand:+ start:102 stop:953 length:852 start_codon:yes stop_codon:yes gene_type:complete